MNYDDTTRMLAGYRREIAVIRDKMRQVQAAVEPVEVRDYEFQASSGSTRLSRLFGAHRDLIVVHNMGRSCAYCTLWADGYNGLYPHIASRAAFVVASPDGPSEQREFAAGRGWRFPLVSHAGTSFAQDMGYRSATGGWLPGLSVFRNDGERVLRVSDTREEPLDDFCALWHLLELFPEGAAGWAPKFRY